MNKVISYTLATLFAACSVTAMACPQGTTLQGGTGPNHKGGKCVLMSKSQAKTQLKTSKTTAAKSLSEKKADANKALHDRKAASKTSLKNTTQQSKDLGKQKLSNAKTSLNTQTDKLSNTAKHSSTASKQTVQQKNTQLKQAKSNVIGAISQ